MNKRVDLANASLDQDDIGYNTSSNESFNSVLETRLSRRSLLRGGIASAAGALFGSVGLTACGGSGRAPDTGTEVAAPKVRAETLLGYKAVGKSLADQVIVPAGYTASVIYALGDPLSKFTSAFKNDGTDTDFENRAGDHHDGMEYFGLSANGKPDPTSSNRGLLAMNHEATSHPSNELSSTFLHADGGTVALPRPVTEIDKEIAIHGVSVVEVKKGSPEKFAYIQNSPFNRRVTPLTPVQLSGVAKGNALVTTKYSATLATNGNDARGTINNCGTGITPWGTLLTGEENFNGYFTRSASDNAARGGSTAKSVVALNRYGRAQGAKSRHGWESGGAAADDRYARWDISQTGADATADYRNELNTFGYIVEIDPYDKTAAIKKRTSLGRFAHESAAFGKLTEGQPVVAYMGDDSRGEYMYKFVSAVNWSSADAMAENRIAVGDKYLDNGKLYVAKFNADGTGKWIELSLANIPGSYTTYSFADQADVIIHARLAADAVGATRMDRPEWCAVHPGTGEIYYTLTNNSNRRLEPTGNQMALDAANPRAYTDKNGSATQNGNVNGHIIRIAESGGNGAATSFNWDVYLFGAQADADLGRVNLSSLTNDQDFSSPDGIWFSRSTGLCWIQTDDGAYTDVTNSMMLAAVPGKVGDGAAKTLSYTKSDSSTLDITTYVGKAATADTVKRFLVGPADAEITGICETPDGKALFVNIQHPGETIKKADLSDPSTYLSHWPANAGYGAGGAATARPRSATIVITKDDGGRIGT